MTLTPLLLLANAEKLNPAIEEAYEGARHSLEIHPFEGGIEGVFPVYGKISLQKEISFQWRGRNVSGKKPVLCLFEREKNEDCFEVVGTNKKITASQLGLRRGHAYQWYLGRMEKGKIIAQSRVFRFTLLSQEESEKLAKELEKTKGGLLLKGQIYYSFQMYHDMVALLEPRYKMATSEGLRKLLFLGYARLGRHHEAKKFRGGAPKVSAPKSGR